MSCPFLAWLLAPTSQAVGILVNIENVGFKTFSSNSLRYVHCEDCIMLRRCTVSMTKSCVTFAWNLPDGNENASMLMYT